MKYFFFFFKLLIILLSIIFLFFFFVYYYFFLIFCFSNFLSVFFKFAFLLLFFLFNIVNFFLFSDVLNLCYLYLDLFFIFDFDGYFFYFFKILILFIFDLFYFLKLFLLNFFDLRNFLGIFFQGCQFVNELFYEAIFMFVEQTEEHTMLAEFNWMPKYLLGDSLERTLRINKILNIFSFSDVLQEKIFVYRRVGILNSRFWLFKSYLYNHNNEDLFKRTVGTLVEPSRWFLDFRDFRISDYIDPWHFFSNKEPFRNSISGKQEYVSVQLLHNYHSIMESDQLVPKIRVYSDYFATTFIWYEFAVGFIFYLLLFAVLDEHLQIDLFGLEDEGLPDQGDMELFGHPFFDVEVNGNLESKLFSEHPLDIQDYVGDDDLSWDFLFAQPLTNRMHVSSDLDEFELYRELNVLLDEFRTFSFLYPLYKLMYKFSFYKFIDVFLLTDSAKCFKIFLKCLLYIPIGLFIIFFKFIILFFDRFFLLSWFLKIIICASFFILFFICFN